MRTFGTILTSIALGMSSANSADVKGIVPCDTETLSKQSIPLIQKTSQDVASKLSSITSQGESTGCYVTLSSITNGGTPNNWIMATSCSIEAPSKPEKIVLTVLEKLPQGAMPQTIGIVEAFDKGIVNGGGGNITASCPTIQSPKTSSPKKGPSQHT